MQVFFMSKQLLTRNGHFYFRQWIPLDVRHLLEGRLDITIALKTKDKLEAVSKT